MPPIPGAIDLEAPRPDREVAVAFKGESGVKKHLLSFTPLEKLS